MVFPHTSNKETNLSLDAARTEVVKDIYEETKELHHFQRKVKTAFEEWLKANIGEEKFTEVFNLIENFDASYENSQKITDQLRKLQNKLKLAENQKAQFEDFLSAFDALSKAFEILRDLEISNEEIQEALADLKAEILKPLEIKGESLDEILSEKAKITLEEIVDTREYENFKNKFLALEGVRKFLREEENDLDFDKNERYNIDTDKLVREVVGYMIDLGLISKPEDLQKIFDKMITVGGVFEYKENGNAKIGKNALFVKVDNKIITVRGSYGTTDIWVLRVGVDKNLKEASSKLGVSPQKLKELLNFDAPYGKIGQEKIAMRVEEGERIEVQGTTLSNIDISNEAKLFLEDLFHDERAYNPEEGKYGLFRVAENGEVFITAPFIKVVENGRELEGDEKVQLYRKGLVNKNIELIVDPVSKNIREVKISDSIDDKTHMEIYAYTPEKASYGGEKLFENFGNLPTEAVAFLNEHMEVDENNKVVRIDGQEIPLGSKVVILKRNGEISYKIEEGKMKNVIEFDYQEDTPEIKSSGFEIYQAQGETDSLKLPEELKNGLDITPDGVAINLESLSKVLGVDLKSASLDGKVKIGYDDRLIVPGHKGTVKILNGPEGIRVTYERGDYPLQLVYVNMLESRESNTITSGIEKRYEIISPVKIDSLEKVRDIAEFVEQNKLSLAKLNMFDEYYTFINAYKRQDWNAAINDIQRMLNSPKAKELGISSSDTVVNKIKSLKGVDLIYALALFVKGTLTDEYLLGENLKGEKVDNNTREKIGREALKVKKEGFINHIRQNWGEDSAEKLRSYVLQLSPQKIDISPSRRKEDKSIVASLVYTKRAKEESFSLLPHGLGDVLEGQTRELNDLVLARKILEKMPQDLLQNVLKNYGIDKYVNVDALSKEEILEMFMGKELIKGETKIRIYGRPLYYLYGECINPTLAYRLEKVVITKQKEVKKPGEVEIDIATKGYRLLQESSLTSTSTPQGGRGWIYFKGELSKTSSQIEKVGKVEVVTQQTTKGEFNTIDVIPEQGTDWLYAMGPVEYTREEEEEKPTTPTEGPTPPPTPSPTPTPTPTVPPERPTTRPTDAPSPPPRPTGSPIDE